MGWEARRGRRYYYRKSRVTVDGESRVVSDYVGADTLAEVVAAQDEAARTLRDWDRDGARAFAEGFEAADAVLDLAMGAAEALAEATLSSLGFYRRRGEWRHARGVDLPENPDLPDDSAGGVLAGDGAPDNAGTDPFL